MKNYFYILLILTLFFDNSAQRLFKVTSVDTIIYVGQKEIRLPCENIISGSVNLIVDSSVIDKGSYQFVNNFIQFNSELKCEIGDTLFIYYQQYPNIYSQLYKNRELIFSRMKSHTDSIQVGGIREINPLTRESIFGGNIKSSGSLSRGFTVGTTKDFSLNSGLRLELSGKLSDEIEIIATLTDENTPIQPDGNTETLEELDKVFIQIKHENVTAIFGDIDYKNSIGQFGKIQRKLKGLQSDFYYENNKASVVYATARGKYTQNSFTGSDGVQGPYRLYGNNNERNIIIIAGSERIYIDGREMKRGENNDYTLNYATGELFFTSNRLISSASRITVDFEYSDRQYRRNYFGVNTDTRFFGDDLTLQVNYFQENDDQDSPLDLILDDTEKEILRNAGADKYAAAVSGARIAESDSLGYIRGNYTRIDTLINNRNTYVYRYLPGIYTSIYNVSFSYVGEGKGEYKRVGIGHYEYVGYLNGNYLPIRFLPLPVSKQLANVYLKTNPFSNLKVEVELAGSFYDANRYSSIDDNNNGGFARRFEIQLDPTEYSLGGFDLGKIGLRLQDRFIDNYFEPLDRIEDIEFRRSYNLSTEIFGNQLLREAELLLNPFSQLEVKTLYGSYKIGESLQTDKYNLDLTLNGKEDYFLGYNYDIVNTDLTNTKSDWIRQNGSAFYKLGNTKLTLNYLYENREEFQNNLDSLSANSLGYLEINPGMDIIDLAGVNITLSYSYREESFPISGEMKLASISNTRGMGINHRSKYVNSQFNIAFRNKHFTDAFKKNGFTNNETVLIKSQNNFALANQFIEGNIFYEAATEKSSKLEKVFIRVPQGTGNYKYLGDLNDNGVSEEYEFEPTIYDGDFILTTYPTDELFPVVDLKFNTRLNIDFKKQFTKNDLFSRLLSAVSGETSWRISENSRESDIAKIYLMNLSAFLNDSTTIYGSNTFTQDIYIHKNKRDFSLRFRYVQQKGLNEYSTGSEKSYLRERSLKLRLGLIKEIINQTEFINKKDYVSAQVFSNRNRQIVNNELNTDFSFRPYTQLELGLKLINGTSDDFFPDFPTKISYNGQIVRINYSIFNVGRVRIELERNEYIANVRENYIPFEITRGNVIGKNYIGRINFEYKIGTNLQTTLNYVGRFHGSGKLINSLRAEARAFF